MEDLTHHLQGSTQRLVGGCSLVDRWWMQMEQAGGAHQFTDLFVYLLCSDVANNEICHKCGGYNI